MALKDRDHRRIELLYHQNFLTVPEIARIYQVSVGVIEGLRNRYGWPMRAELPKPGTAGIPALEPQSDPEPQLEQEAKPAKRRPATASHTRLRRRAQAILAQQIAEIESGLDAIEASDTGRSAADRERDARTLASLTRTLDNLREQELADKAARAGAKKTRDQRSDEDIRKDLERRISRIVAAHGQK